MSQQEKILYQVLVGTQDSNISFSKLCQLMTNLGFEMRQRSSHHIFFKEGIEEILNLQPLGSKAKSYQVKQVRNVIQKNKLGEK